MAQIRIALCGLSTMADDVVTALLADAQGIDVVARLEPSDDLAADFRRSGADVLICAEAESAMRSRWTACMERLSPPAVLNLGADAAGGGHVYAMQAHDAPLEALDGESLLVAVRALGIGHIH